MRAIIPNLWTNDGTTREVVDFYLRAFADPGDSSATRIVSSTEHGPEAGELAGQPMVINFVLRGQQFAAINGGGTSFAPNESLSLAVPCDDQAEIDRLWAALAEGGKPGPCGWLADRYGFAWQVYPAVLDEMMADPDPARVARVTACFMAVDQVALSLADLQAAYDGD